MQLIARVAGACVLLLALAVGLLVAAENTDRVPLVLAGVALPDRSVGFWLVSAFILGALVGMLARLGIGHRSRD